MPKILFVDDDQSLLDGLRRQLRGKFDAVFLADPHAAMPSIDADPDIAVIVSDMRMPGMDGTRLLEAVAMRHPRVSRLMMTGDADQHTAAAAVNRGGVLGFLQKPCAPDALSAMLERALRQHELETQEQQLLERTLAGSIRIMFDVLAAAQPQQFGRATRLRELARLYGRQLGTQAWITDMAAMLSGIGALLVPVNGALGGGDPLQSAAAGATLIAHVPRLGALSDIIRYKPVRFDGTGSPAAYPSGTALPLEARMLAILDDLLDLAGAAAPQQRHISDLARRQGRYDPHLLAELMALLPAEPLALSEVEIDVGFVNSLSVGDRLLDDVCFGDGQLALAGGHRPQRSPGRHAARRERVQAVEDAAAGRPRRGREGGRHPSIRTAGHEIQRRGSLRQR